MAKTRQKTTARFDGVIDLLSRLEREAEKVVRHLIDRAEDSSRELKEGIADLIGQIKTDGLYSVATEKRTELQRLATKVIKRAKEIEFGSFGRDLLMREAKRNLEDLVETIQASELFGRARDTARQTKEQVLSVLSIPSQDEVVKLSRKITSLEQRMNKLTRKAA